MDNVPPASEYPTVVLGAYGGKLFGFRYIEDDQKLLPAFLDKEHDQTIKSLAISQSGRYLASGSSDQFIRIHDLSRAKSIGLLNHHDDDIEFMEFIKDDYLLSASRDGKIFLLRTSDWEVLLCFNEHRKAVTGLSIHPSMKTFISCDALGYVRLWDLNKGKEATYAKLDYIPEGGLSFNEDGTLFSTFTRRTVYIHDIISNDIRIPVAKADFDKSVTALAWLSADAILVGHEDGSCDVYSVLVDEDGSVEMELVSSKECHDGRVKSISVYNYSQDDSVQWASCSTTGHFGVFKLNEEAKIEEIVSDALGSRITRILICPTFSKTIHSQSKSVADAKSKQKMLKELSKDLKKMKETGELQTLLAEKVSKRREETKVDKKIKVKKVKTSKKIKKDEPKEEAQPTKKNYKFGKTDNKKPGKFVKPVNTKSTKSQSHAPKKLIKKNRK